MSVLYHTVPKKLLARAIITSDVTFNLSDIKGWNKLNLTPDNFGTQAYGVFFNSKRDRLEIFEFDPATINAPSISFVARGLSFSGDFTPISTNKKDWPAGTIVQIGADVPQMIANLRLLTDLDTDPTLAANSDVKIATQKAIKAYYGNLVFAPVAIMTTLVKGKAKMSTAPADAMNPIALENEDPRIPIQDENDAAAGTSGPPSGSNVYVTESDSGLDNNMNKTTDQEVDGIKTFTSIPIIPTTPTDDNHLIPKSYIDAR